MNLQAFVTTVEWEGDPGWNNAIWRRFATRKPVTRSRDYQFKLSCKPENQRGDALIEFIEKTKGYWPKEFGDPKVMDFWQCVILILENSVSIVSQCIRIQTNQHEKAKCTVCQIAFTDSLKDFFGFEGRSEQIACCWLPNTLADWIPAYKLRWDASMRRACKFLH